MFFCIFFFPGLVDELTIWNRALSSSEIQNLYNGGQGKTACTLIESPEPEPETPEQTPAPETNKTTSKQK